jgi:hypothetical protein
VCSISSPSDTLLGEACEFASSDACAVSHMDAASTANAEETCAGPLMDFAFGTRGGLPCPAAITTTVATNTHAAKSVAIAIGMRPSLTLNYRGKRLST